MEEVAKANIIEKAVGKELPIILTVFSFLEPSEKQVDFIIQKILEKYNKVSLKEAIYSCLKEMIINAVKANMKRVIFSDLGINANDEKDYERGMKKFKEELRENKLEEYAVKIKKSGYYVKIDFDYNFERMIVQVINNSIISKQEDARLREKFKNSMRYEDLAQFYMENVDETEGQGLGVTMLTIILKGESIDPHCFTIRSDDKETTATLEVPFSDTYKTLRQQKIEKGIIKT